MNEEIIKQLVAKVAQDEAILIFDKTQLELANTGWKTDQDALGNAVAPLNAKIVELESILSTIKGALPVGQ